MDPRYQFRYADAITWVAQSRAQVKRVIKADGLERLERDGIRHYPIGTYRTAGGKA